MAIRKVESYNLADALSAGFRYVAELCERIHDAYDNVPESLQGGDRGCAWDEAATALECIEEMSLPDALGVTPEDGTPGDAIRIDILPLRKNPSRSDQLSQAVSILSNIRDAVQEKYEDEFGKDDEDESIESIAQFVQDLGEVVDELESIELNA